MHNSLGNQLIRRVAWVSAGAASAVAAKLALSNGPITPVYCETGAEDKDNARFLTDVEKWLGLPVERIRSEKYSDTWSVWEDRRYMAGIAGAPCTSELKISPRLAFQRPTDTHVFGYTADSPDVARATRLKENYPELILEFPLIQRGITKSACLAMLKTFSIKPPRTYAMGFPNANCIPCVKATSPAYWALIRKHFPIEFERAAKLSREIGARLCRIGTERAFIDEIPDEQPTTNPIAPSCDFLCAIAEDEIDEKTS